VVKLTWDGATVRFKNHDWRHGAFNGMSGSGTGSGGAGGAGSGPFGGYATPSAPNEQPGAHPGSHPAARASASIEPAPFETNFDAPAPFNAESFPGDQFTGADFSGEPSPFDESVPMDGGSVHQRPPGGAFAPGRSTGPVSDHRDGGGPDVPFDDDLDEDDLDIPI
jgi:hypothetical protein